MLNFFHNFYVKTGRYYIAFHTKIPSLTIIYYTVDTIRADSKIIPRKKERERGEVNSIIQSYLHVNNRFHNLHPSTAFSPVKLFQLNPRPSGDKSFHFSSLSLSFSFAHPEHEGRRVPIERIYTRGCKQRKGNG